MRPATPYLFAYGSLRVCSKRAVDHVLDRGAERVGPATAPGRLYLIHSYPGLVPAQHPGERVFGELFRLRDPMRSLRVLDAYEGLLPPTKTWPDLFVRRVMEVSTPAGERVDAWVYVYNFPVIGRPRIASGDFLHYRRGAGRKARGPAGC